ncbi:MAG: hypothetical protein ACXAEL_08500 [Candidatus Hodarchaeales archaeon]
MGPVVRAAAAIKGNFLVFQLSSFNGKSMDRLSKNLLARYPPLYFGQTGHGQLLVAITD